MDFGAPSVVASMKAVGDGWYALVEQPVGSQARFLHVYRLADAHHWQVATPADIRPTDVVHVDADEVWFTGMSLNEAYVTVIRQQLPALGPEIEIWPIGLDLVLSGNLRFARCGRVRVLPTWRKLCRVSAVSTHDNGVGWG